MNRAGWKTTADGTRTQPTSPVGSHAAFFRFSSARTRIDDEDTNDDQPSNEERQRFSREKEQFKRKYKEQIEQLNVRWQARQAEIQRLAARNASAAQQQYETSEIDFRREYDSLKQAASRERTQLNELHEIRLDIALNAARTEANQKLIDAWNGQPLKVGLTSLLTKLFNSLLIYQRDEEGRLYLLRVYIFDKRMKERNICTCAQRLIINNRSART